MYKLRFLCSDGPITTHSGAVCPESRRLAETAVWGWCGGGGGGGGVMVGGGGRGWIQSCIKLHVTDPTWLSDSSFMLSLLGIKRADERHL